MRFKKKLEWQNVIENIKPCVVYLYKSTPIITEIVYHVYQDSIITVSETRAIFIIYYFICIELQITRQKHVYPSIISRLK